MTMFGRLTAWGPNREPRTRFVQWARLRWEGRCSRVLGDMGWRPDLFRGPRYHSDGRSSWKK